MALQNQGVGAEGLLAAASTLSKPSDEFGNDERVEALWAIKAMEHAEVYFNILCSVNPRQIPRLSPCDNEIYEKFRQDFPDFNVNLIKEESLKSNEAKEEWRKFCESFKHVEDFSFATLLRLDSTKDYSEENSIICTKIQFYAIELARNREGGNDEIRGKFKPTPRKPKNKSNESDSMSVGHAFRTKEVEEELKQILAGQHQLMQ